MFRRSRDADSSSHRGALRKRLVSVGGHVSIRKGRPDMPRHRRQRLLAHGQAGGLSGREPPRDRRSVSCGSWCLSGQRATSRIRPTPFTARRCERATIVTGCNRHSWTSSSIKRIATMSRSSTKRATCPERGTSMVRCSPTDHHPLVHARTGRFVRDPADEPARPLRVVYCRRVRGPSTVPSSPPSLRWEDPRNPPPVGRASCPGR